MQVSAYYVCVNLSYNCEFFRKDVNASYEFIDRFFYCASYTSTVLAVIVCLSVCPSVYPSVRPSVCTKMAKPRITQTMPHDSPGTLVF